ncbi:MAG: GNAT family N-acetyltransferase [Epsilonproteobacteria bacterium]|nr:GNAT family N-acetyltransferase [Campylobacterota bacterium]
MERLIKSVLLVAVYLVSFSYASAADKLPGTIETERLMLRSLLLYNESELDKLSQEYFNALTTYGTSDEVNKKRFCGCQARTKPTQQMVLKWLKNQQSCIKQHYFHGRGLRLSSYLIFLKNKNLMIGEIGLHSQEPNMGWQLGYWLSKNYQQNGYMKEASRALMPHYFDGTNAPFLYAHVLPTNTPSQNLAQSLGFEKQENQTTCYFNECSIDKYMLTYEKFSETKAAFPQTKITPHPSIRRNFWPSKLTISLSCIGALAKCIPKAWLSNKHYDTDAFVITMMVETLLSYLILDLFYRC